jgi:hypothetical protein
MSLLANQTNINKETAFFLLANMSSLNANSISTGRITTSSISATTANISSLTAANGNFSSIFTDYLSSGIADITDITTSTIFATAGVFINGAELTTAGGTELLLNGVPLATTTNLSTLADWAIDPAISSVNMSGFDLLNTNLVSTINLRAASAFIQNLLAWNILAVSSFTSSISSLSMQTDELFVSSVKGDTGIFDNYLQTSSISSGNITVAQVQTSTVKDTGSDSYLTFNGGDIYINSQVGGAGIYLTPLDEVAIQDPATGQTYGLLASYVRGVSSISDVSTINNIPYPPPGTGSTISTFQTVTATEYISTPDLRVSSINGAELNGNTIIISSINTQSVSTNELQVNLGVVSSIQLKPSVGFNPSLSVDMGLGSLFTNVAGAALGGMNMIVGGIALATGVTAIYQGRQTKTVNLSTFELINGTTQLQVSTLGLDVSTVTRYVSSLNADTPGEEYFISTIIPAGTPLIRSFSDPMNTISSPASSIQAFSQWVALPQGGSISSLEFSSIICSSLTTAEGISTNGLSAQFVIGEQIISTPLLFVSSINNNSYPPPQQIVSTFPGSIYVADSIFAASTLSTFNINVGNVISTNGLSGGFVIASALVSTPQLFTSTINNSSIQSLFPATRIGQYYKSAPQTLNNGNTDMTFDLTQSWNNTAGYITHTNGSTDFTVVQPGIYQLEFNATVLANGAVYSLTTIGKSVAIDITRTGTAEQSVAINSALQASLQAYAQSVNATFYLNAGDVINLRIGNTFTSGGPPTAAALQNTFDLNTFFTWTYMS